MKKSHFPPTKEERERYIADCNRGGVCRLDMESAIRNNILQPMYTHEMFENSGSEDGPAIKEKQ